MMSLCANKNSKLLINKEAQINKFCSIIFFMLALSACSGGGEDLDPGTFSETVPDTVYRTVPDTGQTSCYYDYTIDGIYNPAEFTCLDPGSGWSPDGQDGYYTINAMSFTDNSDGTILDNVTGLTWQKCSIGRTDVDCSTGTSTPLDWNAARNQCANLNLVGTEWRLPTATELTQIADYGKSFAIDSVAFPNSSSAYWSSTAHASQAWAWYVYFIQGGITWADNQTAEKSVRCVRG